MGSGGIGDKSTRDLKIGRYRGLSVKESIAVNFKGADDKKVIDSINLCTGSSGNTESTVCRACQSSDLQSVAKGVVDPIPTLPPLVKLTLSPLKYNRKSVVFAGR